MSRSPARAPGGPGWHRMWGRLGPARMEEMRLATVREQEEALGAPERNKTQALPSDRESSRGYPPPAPRRGKKGRA